MISEKKIKLIYNFIFLFIFAIILRVSLLTPMVNEDFDLNISKGDFTGLINGSIYQYSHWNARIGDILSLVFSMIPIDIFNLINSVAITFFIWTILYIPTIFSEKKPNPATKSSSLIFVFLAFIFFIQKPGEIFFWRTGSANYLYPALGSLWYVIPFLMLLFKKIDIFKIIKNRYFRILLISIYSFAGLIIAHANENTSPVILFLLVLVVIYFYFKEKKIKMWMILSLIMYTAGSYLLIFGPSTLHRIKFYSSVFSVSSSPMELFIMNFQKTATFYIVHGKFPLLIVLFFLITFIFYKNNKKKIIITSFFVFISFLTAIILAAAPYQESRAFFISYILLIITVVFCFYSTSDKFIKNFNAYVFLTLLMMVIFQMKFFINEYNNMKIRYIAQNERIRIIKNNLDEDGDIEIPPMPIVSSRLMLVGGTSDEAERMARFFHLKDRKIIIKKNY